MQTKTTNIRKQLKKEEGFTLVEVIAVLVILGILAAVAIPKFFDMQETARNKAIAAAVGELNGQVALSFAQNALTAGVPGEYKGYTGNLGPDFTFTTSVADTTAVPGPQPQSGVAYLTSDGASSAYVWTLTWTTFGTTDSPGYFVATKNP